MKSRSIARPGAYARSGDEPLRPRGGMAVGLAFVLTVATAVLLASCATDGSQRDGNGDVGEKGRDDTRQQGPETGRTRPAERVTVEELTANPSGYYGERVAVSGKVIEVVEPGAFRLEKEGAQLLVAGVEQIPQIVTGDTKAVTKGDTIKVNGEVREFEKEELQKKVDYGIDEQYFGDYEGDPAVLAYSVEVMS